MVGSEVGVRGRLQPVTLGTVLFIASELMFFSGFFASYYLLRARTDPWPPSGVELSLGEPLILTGLLITSSITAHLAVVALRGRSVSGMNGWLGATVLLGVVFLGLTVDGWLGESFGIGSHAYGTLFFAMTGFHAAHVLGGVVLFIVIMGRAAQGAYAGGGEHAGPESAVYYWHFVDVVWLGVFSSIYLVR